jgi:hypothetical protein
MVSESAEGEWGPRAARHCDFGRVAGPCRPSPTSVTPHTTMRDGWISGIRLVNDEFGADEVKSSIAEDSRTLYRHSYRLGRLDAGVGASFGTNIGNKSLQIPLDIWLEVTRALGNVFLLISAFYM